MAVAVAKVDAGDGNEDSLTLSPEEELFRARVYGLLARLLARPPDRDFLAELAALNGDRSELGMAFDTLAQVARASTPARLADEYHELFIGLGRGELVPYGSYYLTGFLNERPLAELRGSLAKLGVMRAENVGEPEDHIAALCETMARLIGNDFGAGRPLSEQREFFEKHVATWAARFFEDLVRANADTFYAAVGRLGQLYLEIEKTAFEMVG